MKSTMAYKLVNNRSFTPKNTDFIKKKKKENLHIENMFSSLRSELTHISIPAMPGTKKGHDLCTRNYQRLLRIFKYDQMLITHNGRKEA